MNKAKEFPLFFIGKPLLLGECYGVASLARVIDEVALLVEEWGLGVVRYG